MKTQKLFVSIALTFFVGCSHGNSDARKHKVLKKSNQPVPESAKNENLPIEGESVTKLDSGFEYRGPANPESTNPPVINLKSGNEVKILAAGKIYLATGKAGWMFQYRTSLKIDDVPTLKEEAEELWPLIKKDVEKGGFDFAVLSANEAPKKSSVGFISNNRGYNFVFEKTESGEWKLAENERKEKSAMLKWDEPGFMDGVRCRPITASKKSKKSAVVGARACLSRGLITGSPYW
jgi:hypothetical protein